MGMGSTLTLMLLLSSIANKESVNGSSLSTPAIESLLAHLSLGNVRERRGMGGEKGGRLESACILPCSK